MIGLSAWALALALGAVELPEGFGVETTEHYSIAWRPGLSGFARALAEQAEAHHERIYTELGTPLEAHTTVFMLRDEGEMLALIKARRGRRGPDWAAGMAFPEAGEIYLHVSGGPAALDRTFQHEISHVAFGRTTDAVSGSPEVPTWFKEGLAIQQSEGLGFERTRLLTEAALVGGLLGLDDLRHGFPRSGPRARLAYAQAVHFIEYLRDLEGEGTFRRLIAAMRDDGRSFEAAMAALYPPLPALERAWRDRLTVWWGWVPVLFGSTTIWSLGVVLLVLAWRRRKRQQRARLRIMAGREAVEAASALEITHRVAPPPEMHDPYRGEPPTIH